MTVAWEPHEQKPRKGKYFYRVQGLDATFDTKAEAVRQARNLGGAVRWACERLGKKLPERIRVSQHER